MTARLFSFYVFFHTLLAGCGPARSERGEAVDATEAYEISQIGKLHKHEIAESSGLAWANATATEFWTHGDGGSPSNLYRVNRGGVLLQTLPMTAASNRDWEDLARDLQGHIFIGDFGNNLNSRRDLRIFRIDPADPDHVDTIRFSYPDQHKFPPKKAGRNFDCEAFYFLNDTLHLFSKNRGKGGLWTKQYTVPARAGTYVATLRDSIELETWITAADISPDGRTVALLGYGFAYLFEGEPKQPVFDRRRARITLGSAGQAEALTFVNNTDFVFSNENGKMFEAKKKP
jgi:hypothetical protein